MEVSFDSVRFSRGGRLILDLPSLTFVAGEATALVGPNGCGKSTLLRLVAALERPDAGMVRIGPSRSTPAIVREHVALAFQQPVFVSGSAGANIDLALRLRRLPAAERAARIRAVSEACGIAQLLDRPVHRLSGGEQQRVNLARALALRAPVTLLDEPLSGLDAPARRQLLHDLPRILRGHASTTIIVTHDRDEALRLAGRVVVLIDGRVAAAGTRAEVFGGPPGPAAAAFLGYILIPGEAGLLAVAPRALRPGPGDWTFEFTVDEVHDFGVRREAWGTIAGIRASVPLPPGDDPPPPAFAVSAAAGSVRVYRS
jgi:ABC-type sugar transport system ATPase subunit